VIHRALGVVAQELGDRNPVGGRDERFVVAPEAVRAQDFLGEALL
jgi:hypothetical protein